MHQVHFIFTASVEFALRSQSTRIVRSPLSSYNEIIFYNKQNNYFILEQFPIFELMQIKASTSQIQMMLLFARRKITFKSQLTSNYMAMGHLLKHLLALRKFAHFTFISMVWNWKHHHKPFVWNNHNQIVLRSHSFQCCKLFFWNIFLDENPMWNVIKSTKLSISGLGLT